MKSILLNFVIFFILGISSAAFADKVVVNEVGIPVVVTGDSYTIVDKPDYYYYPGHRCYLEKREGLGINFLGLHAGFSGGSDIYCYEYP